MRRAVILVPLLTLGAGAGATAIAQESPREPDVRPREVFSLPGVCRPVDRVTVGIDPSGTALESVRVHVAGLQMVRLTDVRSPATATVRIPKGEPTRVTATGDTAGGQSLYFSRTYGRCRAVLERAPGERPLVSGGED